MNDMNSNNSKNINSDCLIDTNVIAIKNRVIEGNNKIQ